MGYRKIPVPRFFSMIVGIPDCSYTMKKFLFFFEVLVQKAWLDSLIVLILAMSILIRFSQNSMEINLADFYAGINTDRLYTEHFQCPVSIKSHIAKSGRYMDKQPQTSNG